MNERFLNDFCSDCGRPLGVFYSLKTPVVSLEALEAYCKEKSKWQGDRFFEGDMIEVSALLSWAKKEAGKK